MSIRGSSSSASFSPCFWLSRAGHNRRYPVVKRNPNRAEPGSKTLDWFPGKDYISINLCRELSLFPSMEIKILCPLWGHEHLDLTDFCRKIREAGYDGIDTWIPEDLSLRRQLFDALQEFELLLVSHQHQARGDHFEDFKDSFRHYLALSAERH